MSLDKPKLADVGALIRSAKLPETTVPVCLAADLAGEWEQLDRQRREAERAEGDSLAGGGSGLRTRMEALRAEMLESTVDFTLRARTRIRFRELIAAHPPRKDAQGNVIARDYLGVNYETFFAALLRESIVDPQLDEETLDLLLDERLTDRQYEDLTDAAWNLNRASVSVPFSLAASPSPTNSSLG